MSAEEDGSGAGAPSPAAHLGTPVGSLTPRAPCQLGRDVWPHCITLRGLASGRRRGPPSATRGLNLCFYVQALQDGRSGLRNEPVWLADKWGGHGDERPELLPPGVAHPSGGVSYPNPCRGPSQQKSPHSNFTLCEVALPCFGPPPAPKQLDATAY